MAKRTIPKSPDPKPQIPPKRERDEGAFLRIEKWDETAPVSWGEFKRLQEAWFAIGDLAQLLKETRSDGPANPCSVLRILSDELGEAVREVEEKFKKTGGAA